MQRFALGLAIDIARVDMAAVFEQFVVQVGAGGATGHADVADNGVLLDGLPFFYSYAAEVGIASAIAVGMLYLNQFAVATFSAGVGDVAARRSPHLGAGGSGIVYSEVGYILL